MRCRAESEPHEPFYDPYMVVWWILLVVKLVVMVQKVLSSGSVGSDRWSYPGFGEPERAIRLMPPFDTHGNFKSREQSISQPRVLVSSPIVSPSRQILLTFPVEFLVLLAVVMRPWSIFLVLCQASNSTRGRFSLSQGSSLLNTLLCIKSGSNFPLLSRLFQLAFQASGNTGPAFCPEALLPQQRTAAFSLGGN